MSNYVLITDNTCDLEDSYYKEHNIPVIMLPYSVDDVVYGPNNTIPLKDFYDCMRVGKMPTTMACNPDTYSTTFRKFLDEGKDILYLAFSSGLSSSYGNAVLASNELLEEYPNRTIKVIDTLCASMGEGLILYKAVELYEKGQTLEEVSKYVEDNKLNVCHYVTVDNLHHLHRGGRVSKATAVVGTLINVKPLIHVDNEGKLISIGNVRGRKKSLLALVNYMELLTKDYPHENDVVMVTHGDCIEDAQFVANEVKKRFNTKEVIISLTSQTIGTHTGPGLVALFFMSTKR